MGITYSTHSIEKVKNSENRGKIINADAIGYRQNEVCGDELSVTLRISDGIVRDAKYDGTCCFVSAFSADKLMKIIINAKVGTVMSLDDIGYLKKVNPPKGRTKCVLLSLKAVRDALGVYDKVNKNGTQRANY